MEIHNLNVMSGEVRTMRYKITMLMLIVVLLPINKAFSQKKEEQRAQFFLEALKHPENIKEQINSYAQYKNDKKKL